MKDKSYFWYTSDVVECDGDGGRDGVCCSSIWMIFVGIFFICFVDISSFIDVFGGNIAYWPIFSRLKTLLRYSIKFTNVLHWFNFR